MCGSSRRIEMMAPVRTEQSAPVVPSPGLAVEQLLRPGSHADTDDRAARSDASAATERERRYVFHAVAEDPGWRSVLDEVDAAAYPTFMQHTDLRPFWALVYAAFPEYQLVLCDERTGQHLAHGNMVPLVWDGTAADLPRSAVEMAHRALTVRRLGARPTAFGALQAVVSPSVQGSGLSQRMLQAMASLAADHGALDLVAPIRPTQKARYPLTTLEQYVGWRRPDGLPVDPWQRAHERLGAVPVGIVSSWLTVSAGLDDWTRWSRVRFPASGSYVVPGALVPVDVDTRLGLGRYVEPHLWMRYRLG
jgi:GNAT superfamily N-acetyltransferase